MIYDDPTTTYGSSQVTYEGLRDTTKGTAHTPKAVAKSKPPKGSAPVPR